YRAQLAGRNLQAGQDERRLQRRQAVQVLADADRPGEIPRTHILVGQTQRSHFRQRSSVPQIGTYRNYSDPRKPPAKRQPASVVLTLRVRTGRHAERDDSTHSENLAPRSAKVADDAHTCRIVFSRTSLSRRRTSSSTVKDPTSPSTRSVTATVPAA